MLQFFKRYKDQLQSSIFPSPCPILCKINPGINWLLAGRCRCQFKAETWQGYSIPSHLIYKTTQLEKLSSKLAGRCRCQFKAETWQGYTIPSRLIYKTTLLEKLSSKLTGRCRCQFKAETWQGYTIPSPIVYKTTQ